MLNPPAPDPTAEPRVEIDPEPRSRKRPALIGAALGALAVTGLIAGIGAVGAGAQSGDDPTTDSSEPSDPPATDVPGADADHADDAAFVAFEECMAAQLGDLWTAPALGTTEIEALDLDSGDIDFDNLDPSDIDFDNLDPSDIDFDNLDPSDIDFEAFMPSEEEIAAFEAAEGECAQHLPADVQAELAAWTAFEDCVNNELGVDAVTSEQSFDEIDDAAWQAADEACRSVLPDDLRTEIEAFDAFDTCLADAGVFDDLDSTVVHVEGPSDTSIVEFGTAGGSVTITGDATDVSVSTTGDVAVLDEAAIDARWAEHDAAFEACEQELPEELRFDIGEELEAA